MVTGLLILFVALSGFLSWKLVRQQRALRLLGHEWRALQAEEKQVFDFLRRKLAVLFVTEVVLADPCVLLRNPYPCSAEPAKT